MSVTSLYEYGKKEVAFDAVTITSLARTQPKTKKRASLNSAAVKSALVGAIGHWQSQVRCQSVGARIAPPAADASAIDRIMPDGAQTVETGGKQRTARFVAVANRLTRAHLHTLEIAP